MDDYFEVFGLSRRLGLDAEALQRRFYELSRAHHPDFHQAAAAAAQAEALATSALVNRAYRALRDPMARVEYLVALEEGRAIAEDAGKRQVPKALLEDMMAVQEALEEARAAGFDEASRRTLTEEHRRLTERRAEEEQSLLAGFPGWDRALESGGDRTTLIARFKEGLATRAYLRTVIEDLEAALGSREESDVSHRRH
jgi:molecular chaperone HscB